MTARLALLDRDGVINQDSPDYIKNVDEWIPIPGSIDAIARLSRNRYRVCIVTNQSGLARGLFTTYELGLIHRRLLSLVTEAGGTVEAILYCPHGPQEQCSCRKPRTGLLVSAAERSRCRLLNAPMVGDSFSDILAARTVGARAMLVKTGKGRQTLSQHPELADQIDIYENLEHAVDELLAAE